MGEFQSFKDRSRNVNWGTNDELTTIEHIRAGAALRMADALEVIAKDKKDLLDKIEKLTETRDRYNRYWREEQAAHKRTVKSRDAYKGLYYRIRSLYNSMIHNC